MNFYASYNDCYFCLLVREPFIHCSGQFKSNGKEITSYGEVIGQYTDCYITIIGEPCSPIQGKHYAVIRRYNDFQINKRKREKET